jgi:hypothetical protein
MSFSQLLISLVSVPFFTTTVAVVAAETKSAIENLYALSPLANASSASPITDIWK